MSQLETSLATAGLEVPPPAKAAPKAKATKAKAAEPLTPEDFWSPAVEVPEGHEFKARNSSCR